MNCLRVTFLLGLGLIVCVSAYSDKSSYSGHSGASYRPAAPAAPARLQAQAPRPAEPSQIKSIHRQFQPARLQAPSYQVQLQPITVVLPNHEKPKAQPIQQQPTYENRVPFAVIRPQYATATPAPAKSLHFQAPSYEQHVQKIEVSAPSHVAPAPQQATFILPAYQTVHPAKFSSGYGGEESNNHGGDGGDGGDDDDEEDDEESRDEKHKSESENENENEKRPIFAQQPIALTYPAFEGYKAQQVFQQVQEAPKQPIYQVQYQRPAQFNYPQVSFEAVKAAEGQNQEEEEESYPDDLSAIPGEPGKDYPNFARLPEELEFSCDDKLPGYYADVDYKCQVWHVCNDGRRQSFLCPNGTIYSQEKFVCEWWFNVDCSRSSSYFGLNEDLYKVPVKVEAPEAQPQPQYAYKQQQQQPQYAYEQPQQQPQYAYVQQQQQPQYAYEQPQQQPPYTVTLPAPQQPHTSSAIYEAPAPIKAQKVVKQKQSRPVIAQYVKSSQLQQQQQHAGYY